jgi:hypothetical protein
VMPAPPFPGEGRGRRQRHGHHETRPQQGDVAMKVHAASVCFKCFQRYVAIVLYGCCKSRSGMLHMLQVFQRHVASVLEVLFKMFHLF